MQEITHSKKRLGFTLAELLVAIAIIGILFAIALPSLSTITGSSKLDSAALSVHSAAKLARQFARTEQQPTYLVLNEGQTDSNLAYRAYAVYTINVHTNAKPVPQGAGYFLRDWESLPAGVVFDDRGDEPNNLFNVDYSEAWNGGFGKYNEIRIQGEPYAVAGFSPSRSLQQLNARSRRLLIAEDFFNPTGGRLGKEVAIDGSRQITDLVYDANGDPQEISP